LHKIHGEPSIHFEKDCEVVVCWPQGNHNELQF
jgi:hypothetical protein